MTNLKKRAYDLAVTIGLEIYTYPPEGGKGRTSWRCGLRSSADQYAKTFDSAEDAAVHFLSTREGSGALKRYFVDCDATRLHCEALLAQAQNL